MNINFKKIMISVGVLLFSYNNSNPINNKTKVKSMFFALTTMILLNKYVFYNPNKAINHDEKVNNIDLKEKPQGINPSFKVLFEKGLTAFLSFKGPFNYFTRSSNDSENEKK